VQLLTTPRRYLCLAEQIKGATAKLLAKTLLSPRYMAQLVLDVPLDVDLEDCKLKGFDRTSLEPILEKSLNLFRQNYRTPAAVWWRS